MPRKSASSPFNAYRKQAYDNIATAHQDRIPDLLDVKEELKRITPPADLVTWNAALIDSAAWAATVSEDDQRTSPEVQASLPGWPDAEDRFWKLDDGERVRVAAATADDHVKHIQLVDHNASQVTAAALAAREKYYRLAPYYARGARTVSEAAAAWQRDHP